MYLKHLKLIALFLIGLTLLACASSDPLQLPPSTAPGNDAGWKDF